MQLILAKETGKFKRGNERKTKKRSNRPGWIVFLCDLDRKDRDLGLQGPLMLPLLAVRHELLAAYDDLLAKMLFSLAVAVWPPYF
ncbi:hypothetical protein [Fictibacillus terranigra]|uniref:Uncharacterized protein n=1 Tax=Fictibacillus terranigra TaxID=3058424 RepID=A0ABT8E2D4_9BACL|nr:hypothetical protein [Fictibacillus sp. CENA-BCM004]MDN4072061.1 hypothetical protein [Fictibacillus sp. CENA-BCM004]